MWPTPTEDGNYNRKGASKKSGDGLATAVWCTPQARDGDQRGPADPNVREAQGHSVSLHDQIGGQLNPPWVEWLMGFPLGWTDSSASETPSSPKSPTGSSNRSNDGKKR
jgi:DNA (cytosine-5)-methyltransferase 1